VGELFFRKSFAFEDDASYPDMNSNTEVYTAGSFVELESLSPLRLLETDDSIVYPETWELTGPGS